MSPASILCNLFPRTNPLNFPHIQTTKMSGLKISIESHDFQNKVIATALECSKQRFGHITRALIG